MKKPRTAGTATPRCPAHPALNSHRRPSYGLQRVYAVAMNDDPIGTKPEPRTTSGSVISLADRDQERRHEAARRLAEKHNASLRLQAPDATA